MANGLQLFSASRVAGRCGLPGDVHLAMAPTADAIGGSSGLWAKHERDWLGLAGDVGIFEGDCD